MQLRRLCTLLALLLLLVACAAPAPGTSGEELPAEEAHEAIVAAHETAIADLQPAARIGRALQVVATTNLVGETVQIVGGDNVELTVLLPAGSDPHAYTATPQDMVALNNADAVFTNGLGLEESLLPTLQELTGIPIIAVNEGIAPIEGDHAGEGESDDEHDHAAGDPHTWQNPLNVAVWATNVGAALGALDPANAAEYRGAAESYADTLESLDAELRDTLAVIPADQRKLVTEHDTFAYFADAYGFTVVGSVIPSFSSLATISARDMAALQDQMRAANARALFVGNTVSPALAQQVAQDTGVPVVRLFSDSLSTAGQEGDTYVGM
ncbi:MAG: metal ABC transporter substrate-binding protein, partial [Caldilineaceae bacterium]